MSRKKKYRSIDNYLAELTRIKELISGLVTIANVFKEYHDSPLIKDKAEEFKKILSTHSSLEFSHENLEFSHEKIGAIYEFGFIRLFASFEAFMCEYLKELYVRYPDSMPTDRKIQVSEILEWKTKKSVHDFIVDHIAIENTYDLLTWEKTLKNSFRIEVFKDKEQKQLFKVLNICRNMLAHSGGKTNSRVLRDFKKIFQDSDKSKGTFKIQKLDAFGEISYNNLEHITKEIVTRLEKNNA